MAKKKRKARKKVAPKKLARWEMTDLRDRQRRFVREYCLSGNASEAYRIAYQTDNAKVSSVESTRLMKDPRVIAEIEAWRKEMAFKFEISSESLMQELASIAYFDMRNLNGVDSLWQIADLPPYVSRAIRKISPGEHGNSVEGYDKVRAIELLRKILKGDGEGRAGQQSRDDARRALFERISGLVSKPKG